MLSMTDKIKAVQSGIGAYPDGRDGPQTWDLLYRQFAKPELPYRVLLFRMWSFIADPKKVVPFTPKGKSVGHYPNCISGSYSYYGQPVSILVQDGKTIRDYSCHCWDKLNGETHFPESVLWYNKDGTYGISQVTKDVHLPDRENILWAIGGAGMTGDLVKDPWSGRMIPGDAMKEYFHSKYGDVWRKTNHIIVGFDKHGYFMATLIKNMDGAQMVQYLKYAGYTHAIKIDGGHVPAVNVDGYRYRSTTPQYYSIKLG